MLNPSPNAAPWHAAMTILSQRMMLAPSDCCPLMPRTRYDCGRRWPFFRPNVSTGTLVTSSPEQKSLPAPARMMHLTWSSSAARSSLRFSSWFWSGIRMALRRYGRLRVRRTMCGSTIS